MNTSYPWPNTFSISGHRVMAANSPSNGRREAVTTLPSDTIAYDDNRDRKRMWKKANRSEERRVGKEC